MEMTIIMATRRDPTVPVITAGSLVGGTGATGMAAAGGIMNMNAVAGMGMTGMEVTGATMIKAMSSSMSGS